MSYLPITTSRFPSGTCISQAMPRTPAAVTIESPAVDCMTDLAQVTAATIEPGLSLRQAEKSMIHQGVRLLFVVTAMPCVEGVVTAYDLQGHKPLQLIAQRSVQYKDLCVADVMTALSDLDTIEMKALRTANVGQLMSTFSKTGHLHLLVLEAASLDAPARIRGLISKTQIQRQLGQASDSVEIASTFTELSRALQ
jgi:CBS-domain-containing membrane protein